MCWLSCAVSNLFISQISKLNKLVLFVLSSMSVTLFKINYLPTPVICFCVLVLVYTQEGSLGARWQESWPFSDNNR